MTLVLQDTKQNKTTNKAYIALFTCASNRVVHLKSCKHLTAREFKRTLNEFIARRGAPRQIVSDTAKTFVAAKTWLEKLRSDDGVNNYEASQSIKWKFNLFCTPWSGRRDFVELLIVVIMSSRWKIVGKAMLSYSELQEIRLDIYLYLYYIPEEFEGRAIIPINFVSTTHHNLEAGITR